MSPNESSPPASPALDFSLHEAELDREIRELRIEGELDLSAVDHLQSRLDAAAMDDVDVLLSLDRCEFIDSTGIAAIVLTNRLMSSKGRRLVLCNASGQVSRILGLTGLTDAGLVFDNTEMALLQFLRI